MVALNIFSLVARPDSMYFHSLQGMAPWIRAKSMDSRIQLPCFQSWLLCVLVCDFGQVT